jgi:hypothetical protein
MLKTYPLVLFFSILVFQNCNSNFNSENKITEISDTIENQTVNYNIFDENSSEEQEIYNQIFPFILNNTFSKNPIKFVKKLGEYYRLDNIDNTSIEVCGKKRLFGSDEKIWFVNCKSVFKDDNCDYPAYYTQFLFSAQGRLIFKNHAQIAEFFPVMKDSVPLFMCVERDCKGNGQHHFYRYENGKIIDVFNVLMNDTPKTYDCNPISGLFKNNVLEPEILDIDEDGFNDIRLSGEWLIPENKNEKNITEDSQFRTKSVTYNFLYKPVKEFFILQ